MPIRLFAHPKWHAHKLIEEFMVLANCVVAQALKDHHIQSLFRVHEHPEPDSLAEVNELLRSLGFNMKVENLAAKTVSDLLAKTHGKKGAITFHQALLRLQKQARYDAEPLGHFGLNLADYTHFTSPIRRYPDLVVHRSIKRLISKGGMAEKSQDAFYQLGEETSRKERRAVDAERFINRRKQCWFMKQHIGKAFEGVVSGITEKGIFVTLPEFVLDGFVPLESMDGFYEFDEGLKCLRKRPGSRTLSMGDPITIQVIAVRIDENRIEFSEAK